MKKKSKGEQQTITGIILPFTWDENDGVSSVVLSATDDEDYIITNGEKFIDMVQCWVTATGTVSRDKRSSKNIRITRYDLLEGNNALQV